MNMLYVNPANQLKYAQCIRLAGPMHHFPNHCHERTSGMSDCNSIEIWKLIPGFGGYFEASSFGRVRSINRLVNGFSAKGNKPIKIQRKGHVLAAQKRARADYMYVNLNVDGKGRNVQVHRLIALAFHGMPEQGMQVCHRNGNSYDNRASNLRWGTRQDNMRDIVAHGTRPKGEAVKSAKLTSEQVLKMRGGYGPAQAMREFGVSRTQYYRVIRRESWAHLCPK